jgi:hypothetical protein
MELTIDEIVARNLALSIKLDSEMRFEEAAALMQGIAWIMTKRKEEDARLRHPVSPDKSLLTRELLAMAEFQADAARKAIDLL